MTTHRFILEPYKGIATRHTCPACQRKRCFSRYIDTEKRISFPDHVGRCDHEQKCGYHFTPRNYFDEKPEAKQELYEKSSLYISMHQAYIIEYQRLFILKGTSHILTIKRSRKESVRCLHSMAFPHGLVPPFFSLFVKCPLPCTKH